MIWLFGYDVELVMLSVLAAPTGRGVPEPGAGEDSTGGEDPPAVGAEEPLVFGADDEGPFGGFGGLEGAGSAGIVEAPPPGLFDGTPPGPPPPPDDVGKGGGKPPRLFPHALTALAEASANRNARRRSRLECMG